LDRITQSGLKIHRAPLPKFGSNDFSRQRRAAGTVRILVGSDHLAFGSGLVDEGYGVGGSTPILRAKGFQMRNVDRNVCFLANSQGFGDRGEQSGTLVAHVAGVEAAVSGCHFGQVDDFRRCGIAAWCVIEARG